MTVAELPASLQSGTKSLAALAKPESDPRIDSAWKSSTPARPSSRSATSPELLAARCLPPSSTKAFVQMCVPLRRRVWRESASSHRLSHSGTGPACWVCRHRRLAIGARVSRLVVPELETILGSLQEASTRRPLLGRWLKEPIASDGPRPLDLMAQQNWRAFRASARLVPVASQRSEAPSSLSRARLRERHGALRAVSGPEPAPAEEGALDGA